MSPCTLGHIHAYTKAILQYAVKKNILKANPAKALDNPPKVKCKEKQIYNPKQLKQILDTELTLSKFVKNHTFYQKRFKAFTRVAIYGCLRRSEMSGLNWEDIIEEDYALSIDRTASNVDGKGLTLLETKNESSEDVIVVGKETIDALLEYKKEIELIFGEEMTSTGKAIFISQSGNRLAPQALNDMWNNFISTTDLPQYTLHSLRHSGATYIYKLTKDIKGASEHLRHSSTEITEQTYLHYDLEAEKDIIEQMQKGLNDTLQKNTNISIPKEVLDEFLNEFIKRFSEKSVEPV